MDDRFEGRSDEELRDAGFEVVRPSGSTAKVLHDLLQGTGPLSHATDRDTSDEGWISIPPFQRQALWRLDTWTALLPALPAGEVRALAFDPSLAVLDLLGDRLVLLPGRRKGPLLLSNLPVRDSGAVDADARPRGEGDEGRER